MSERNPILAQEAPPASRALMDLLARQIDAFTGGDSSVPYETAERLYASICMTVSLGEGADENARFESGQRALRRRTEAARARLIPRLNDSDYGNRALAETVQEALTMFFRDYNPAYFAQEIPCMIVYPLAVPVPDLPGILYIERYLNALEAEHRFLARFSERAVRDLLRRHHPDYEDLLLNVFSVVFENAAALALLRREVAPLILSARDRDRLRALLLRPDAFAPLADPYQNAARAELLARVEKMAEEADPTAIFAWA